MDASRKSRYLKLREQGVGPSEAAQLVGISRTTGHRWSKDAAAPKAPPRAGMIPNDHETGPTHGDPRPPGSPGAAGQPRGRGPLRNRSSLRDALEEQVRTGVLDAEADLEALDTPPTDESPKPPDDLNVIAPAGDAEEPSMGYGQRAIPEGHPALRAGSWNPMNRRIDPSSPGPDPDLAANTMRADGRQAVAASASIDPRTSQRAMHRRSHGTGTRRGFVPPMIVGP